MKVEYSRRSDGMVNKWIQVPAGWFDDDQEDGWHTNHLIWVVDDVITESYYQKIRHGPKRKRKK